MKERNEKIAAFIEKIGSPGLEGESQSVLLPSVLDNIGGAGSNDRSCKNSSEQTCYDAINGNHCVNYSNFCGKSSNRDSCINTSQPAPPSVIEGSNGGSVQPNP